MFANVYIQRQEWKKIHDWDLKTPVCARDFFFWMSAAGCNGIPDINQRKTKNKNQQKTTE